mmetsp:Transcript_43815/g.68518  ORF Transcript_43815/g.68518 Transcript_43815/m.68518 type:complete len:157 (-) Transcript_43815:128-598(-)
MVQSAAARPFLLYACVVLFFLVVVHGMDAKNIRNLDEWAELKQDDKVWMVEFYSDMCGACQEFEATLEKIAKNNPEVSLARVQIDNADGAAIAERIGVFDEAVPNMRLLYSTLDFNGASIFDGLEDPSADKISGKIRRALETHNSELKNGKFYKRS